MRDERYANYLHLMHELMCQIQILISKMAKVSAVQKEKLWKSWKFLLYQEKCTGQSALYFHQKVSIYRLSLSG
jgi:hypothetical protein